jgi:hypothetical protein
MRRILLMVFALAMFMGLTTTGAMASAKKSDKGKPHSCTYGKTKSGKCKPKPGPEECEHGVTADHQCMPKPEDCKYGMTTDGKCKPKPPECPYGSDDHGMCKPPPVVYPPPAAGPCAKADLVLLEDLLKGTGGLACLYLGDNAPNAMDGADCSGALLALPLDHLLGVCLFLPPADVGGSSSMPDLGGMHGTPLMTSSGGPLDGLVKQLTGLFKLV